MTTLFNENGRVSQPHGPGEYDRGCHARIWMIMRVLFKAAVVGMWMGVLVLVLMRVGMGMFVGMLYSIVRAVHECGHECVRLMQMLVAVLMFSSTLDLLVCPNLAFWISVILVLFPGIIQFLFGNRFSACG